MIKATGEGSLKARVRKAVIDTITELYEEDALAETIREEVRDYCDENELSTRVTDAMMGDAEELTVEVVDEIAELLNKHYENEED